jgi:hypothetical protein
MVADVPALYCWDTMRWHEADMSYCVRFVGCIVYDGYQLCSSDWCHYGF